MTFTFAEMFDFIRNINREVAESGYSTVRCDKEFFIDLENLFENIAEERYLEWLEEQDDG